MSTNPVALIGGPLHLRKGSTLDERPPEKYLTFDLDTIEFDKDGKPMTCKRAHTYAQSVEGSGVYVYIGSENDERRK